MKKPKILIAEKDFSTRKQLILTATEAGYQVKTAITIAPLLHNLLRKEFPVVLLGDNFEKNIPVADLLRLMKASHPLVAIILVSDEISLLQVRKARELGIFYHALKPVNPEDWQELASAMACAFKSRSPAASKPLPGTITAALHRIH